MHETPGNEKSVDAQRRTARTFLLLALFALLLAGVAFYCLAPRGKSPAGTVAPAVAPVTRAPIVVEPPASTPAPGVVSGTRPAQVAVKKNPVAVAPTATLDQLPGPAGSPAVSTPVAPPAVPAAPAEPVAPAVTPALPPATSPAVSTSTRITPWPFGLVPGIAPAVACARLVQESGGTCSARLDSGGALELRVRPEDPDWPSRLRESLDSLGWQEDPSVPEDGARYRRQTARGDERFEWTTAGADWTLRLVAAPGR